MINKKEYMKTYNFIYSKSELGVLRKIYSHMNERTAKNSKFFKVILFSFDDFYYWAINKTNFRELFLTWRATGYKKDYKPSIDRIDDYGSYEFSNMQFLTWRENWFKGVKSQKNINQAKININSNKNNRKGKSKKIKVYYKITDYTKIFNSRTDFAKDINLDVRRISDSINGKKIKGLENYIISNWSSDDVTND